MEAIKIPFVGKGKNKLWVHLENGMFLTTEMKCDIKQ